MHSPHVSKSSFTATATAASTSTTTTVAVSGVSQPESAAGQHQQGAFVGLSTTAHTPESTRISSTYYQQDELRLLSDISAPPVNPFEALATHQTVTFGHDDQGQSASCSLSLSVEPARSEKSSQPIDDVAPIVREEQSVDPTDKWLVMIGCRKRPFKCGYKGCGRQYSKEEYLRIHFIAHTGDSKLRCHLGECTGKFIYRNTQALIRHMQVTHSFEKFFRCEICDRQFRRKDSLRRHKEFLHRGIEEEKNLQTYFVTHTDDSELRCHLGECAGIVTYPNSRALAKHMKAAHTERRFESKICNKRFKRADHLKYHSRHLHSPEEEKQSPKPQSVSKSSSTADTSTITSGNPQPESAGQRPGAPFMGLSKTVRTPESTQTPEAGQQFSGLRLLADVSTSQINSFDDEAVTAGIVGVPNLPSDQHQTEQSPDPTDTSKWIIVDKSQERPYKCGYPGCDKSYKYGNHLKGHFIKHTGTSNFRCPHPECVGNEYFRDSGMLKTHIFIKHIREKPSQCDDRDKPFQCDRCNRGFRRKDRFKHHRKRVHGIEEEKKLPKRKKE